MELRITDGERARYTQIHGMDPLACDGWLTRRMKHELTVLGCHLAPDFDLLNVSDGQIIEAPAMRRRSTAVVQIEKKREKEVIIFCVVVRW